ncbi:MAG: dTMP kinase [Firmicutes bacterium]|nr:dTMP kinase [Bacillota bacterium]
MKGLFISVEGTDGAGKSTQIDLLLEYLKAKGVDVIYTREPGGTYISEKIRNIILDTDNEGMTGECEALLYAASRAQHVKEKIVPALNEGKMVICDRYVDSSIVYQGVARGLGIDEVRTINDFAIGGVMPDLTLFFDLTVEESVKRKKNMGSLDRIEKESFDFHKKIYDGYVALAESDPERIKRIDASKPVEEVHAQVLKVLEGLI